MQTTNSKTTKTTETAAKATKTGKTARPAAARPVPAGPRGLPIMLALDALAPDPANVRPPCDDGLDALAASLAAHGVIQPLTVRPEVKSTKGGAPRLTGRYLVVAGGRRLRALRRLAGQKRLPKDAGVPCVIRAGAGEAEAREVSLAENVERLPMNPADEHAAFAVLADGGLSVSDIAARFGVNRRRVEQRLALGRIAHDLLDELRSGAMSPGLAQALTLTADHARQREAWRQCRGGWNAEAQARRLLTETAMGLDDPLLLLVGRDAYAAAGGTVRVDLFGGEGDGGGFAEDAALVRRLAGERLDAEAEQARADGWAFAVHTLQPGVDPYAYRREHPERREPTEAERARREEIEEELTAMEDRGWDDATDEGRAERAWWDALEAEHEAVEAGREGWTSEQKSRCGVYLSVGESGRVEHRRGLIDPAWERRQAEERRAEEARAASAGTGTDSTPDATAGGHDGEDGSGGAVALVTPTEPAESVELSRALVWRLTKARTEALRAEMVARPAAAADLLVARLCERLFYDAGGADALPLQVAALPGRDDADPRTGQTDPARGSGGDDRPTAAQRVYFNALQSWRSRLPRDPVDLPASVAALSPEDRTALLGLVAAACLNTVAEFAGGTGGPSDAAAARVAGFVGCDVRLWWRPTAADLFGGMTKAGIAAAVAEALPGEPAKAREVAGLKKADAACRAEAWVAGTGWLPAPLRSAHRPRPVDTGSDAPMKLAA